MEPETDVVEEVVETVEEPSQYDRRYMQFTIGCIDGIPDAKLSELSILLTLKEKEEGKKVAALISKNKPLSYAYITRHNVQPVKLLPEQLAKIRDQQNHEFELALLAYPEAFVAYQRKQLMISLNNMLKEEKIKRTPVKPNKN